MGLCSLDRIGVKRSVEMLELQRVQRFPASPTNPDPSVFEELFPATQPALSQPNTHVEEEKQWRLNWNPLAFGWTFQRKGP